ncbi:DNA polymerase V-like [Trifolium medium]|uniref:DNA polymerase V-like n=1 Tax=Trifolium medium TaxID=97028 RepID=A0A392REC2_9FABA|nr:DNA polymerase V-like [Trifolium medium]
MFRNHDSVSFLCARQGFALGLTVLVGAIDKIRVGSFLKLVVDLLEVTSSMKGQV